MNHYRLAKTKDRQDEILEVIINLCKHIKKECEDIWLAKQANSIEAVSYLMLQRPLDVLEVLEGTIKPISADEVILSSAYHMRGNTHKAKSVLQISIYQDIIKLADFASAYLSLYIGQKEKFDESYRRFISLVEVFEIEKIRPDLVLKIYYVAALEFLNRKDEEKVLEMLTNFVKASTNKSLGMIFEGDTFFDLINEWFKEFDINKKAPRDLNSIKEDLLKMVKDNPAFDCLSDNPGYKNAINSLELNLNK
jgi:hypothetical protein